MSSVTVSVAMPPVASKAAKSALCQGYGIGYDNGGTSILKTGFDVHSDQHFILDNEHRLSGERQLT